MQTMDGCLRELYERGQITYEVATAHMLDSSYLKKRF
jgi:hypothetical protein